MIETMTDRGNGNRDARETRRQWDKERRRNESKVWSDKTKESVKKRKEKKGNMTGVKKRKECRSRENTKERREIRTEERTAVSDVKTDVKHWVSEETIKKRKGKTVGKKFRGCARHKGLPPLATCSQRTWDHRSPIVTRKEGRGTKEGRERKKKRKERERERARKREGKKERKEEEENDDDELNVLSH